MKKILAELWFEDDFIPPKYFNEPSGPNDWDSKCKDCPLHSWNDDYGLLDCHFCGDWEEEGEKSLCPIKKYFTEEQPSEQYRDRRGVPGGMAMYELFSVLNGYNEIATYAMELVLTKGPDALMGQLDYDNIEFVKEHPAVYKRAIDLGILTGDE